MDETINYGFQKPEITDTISDTFKALYDNFEKIDKALINQKVYLNVKSFGAKGNGFSDDTEAIGSALGEARSKGGGVIYFPKGVYLINKTLKLGENISLVGESQNVSIIDSTSSGFAFEYTTENYLIERNAPEIRNLQIKAYNGVKLNDPNGGFTDTHQSQNFMMRALIENCRIYAKTSGSGIGVQWSKTFDSHIHRCIITGFEVGIDFHGCDICTIRHNRLGGASKALIRLKSYGTFGSMTLIEHNDMLWLSGGCFIETSDYHARIGNNFFEAYAKCDCVIKVLGGYSLHVVDNRVDVSYEYAPNWIKFYSTMENILISGNHTQGIWMGTPYFEQDPLYFYNFGHRQKLTHFANSEMGKDGKANFPFNSKPEAVLHYDTAYIFSPDYPGLTSANYGLKVRIKDKSFIVPPIKNYGSLLRFDSSVSGNFDIIINAKSETDGQKLFWQVLNGDESIINGGEIILITDYRPYHVTTNIHAKNAMIKIWNDDTTTNSNVLLREITLKYSNFI